MSNLNKWSVYKGTNVGINAGFLEIDLLTLAPGKFTSPPYLFLRLGPSMVFRASCARKTSRALNWGGGEPYLLHPIAGGRTSRTITVK